MNQELREIVERMHKHEEAIKTDATFKNSPHYRKGAGEFWEWDVVAIAIDNAALATAYLAEHPADEDVQLDENWIRSICYEASDDGLFVVYDDLNVAINFVGTPKSHVWSAQLGDGGFYWPHDLHTRGCVRRLCKALGVELKEVAKDD